MPDTSLWYLYDEQQACGIVNKNPEEMIKKYELIYNTKYIRYDIDFPRDKFLKTGYYYDESYLVGCGVLLEKNSHMRYYYIPEGPYPIVIGIQGFNEISILVAPRLPLSSECHDVT